jgi:hypothetical protein
MTTTCIQAKVTTTKSLIIIRTFTISCETTSGDTYHRRLMT